jgi:hypothetical protein
MLSYYKNIVWEMGVLILQIAEMIIYGFWLLQLGGFWLFS